VRGAKLQKLGKVQAIVSQGVRRQLPLHPQVAQEIFQMVPAAHGHGIPGKGSTSSPLTHLKDRYYHEVAAMPKIIGGRETSIPASTRKEKAL
jgi:hypothetical protein